MPRAAPDLRPPRPLAGRPRHRRAIARRVAVLGLGVNDPVRRVAGVALLLALAACGGTTGQPESTPRGPLAFREVAAEAGLDRVLVCGEPGAKLTILEVNGNGMALADLDGDGDLDLLLVQGSTRAGVIAGETVTHSLLRHDGVVSGIPRFTDVGAQAGLVMSGWPTGACAGDVDDDGRPDLVIGGHGEDALFLNRTNPGGPLRFEKHALPGRRSPLDWTTSLALGDADGDGIDDLYLVRYLELDPADPPLGRVGDLPCLYKGIEVMCGPHGLPPQRDVLLRGLGQAPWFEESDAKQAGLQALPASFGLGVLFADLDDDGVLDLYVANDSVDNFVLRGLGGGRFEDHGALSGAAADMAGKAQAGMGVALGDVDEDGDFDLAVTNFEGETLTLYRNEGRLLFRDVTAAARLALASRDLLGWGVHLADLDADGHLDLVAANGHVYPQAEEVGGHYAQPVMLHRGDGAGRFGDQAFPDETPLRGRTMARGDLDDDGDLDLVVLTLDGTPRLLLNGTDTPAAQLLVDLRGRPGTPGGLDAFGAVLRIETADGVLVRQKLSASAIQSSSDPRLHLAGRGPVTAAQVRWPGGEVEPLDPSAVVFGRQLVVRRGSGIVSSHPLEGSP